MINKSNSSSLTMISDFHKPRAFIDKSMLAIDVIINDTSFRFFYCLEISETHLCGFQSCVEIDSTSDLVNICINMIKCVCWIKPCFPCSVHHINMYVSSATNQHVCETWIGFDGTLGLDYMHQVCVLIKAIKPLTYRVQHINANLNPLRKLFNEYSYEYLIP